MWIVKCHCICNSSYYWWHSVWQGTNGTKQWRFIYTNCLYQVCVLVIRFSAVETHLSTTETIICVNNEENKANLRDLIAATGLVTLLKLDSNRRFFARVTLKFDGWLRKIIRHVFHITSSFVYHFRSISEFKLELQSGNAQSGSNSMIFLAVWPCNLTYDLEQQQGTSFMLLQAMCIIS